jgi:iron(III) transport system permease protein
VIRRTAAERWTGRGAALVLGTLFLSPLAAAYLPLLSGADLAALFQPARQAGLLWNTALIAGGAALLATALGGTAGLCLGYLRIPGRRYLLLLLSLPLLLPPYLYAVVWVDLAGQNGWINRLLFGAPGGIALPVYSRAAVMLVLGLAYAALPMLTVVWRLRTYDRSVDEAAQLFAGRWRTFTRVTFPVLIPALATGASIVFLLSLLNYAVPSLLQVQVYTVEIYTSFNSLHDPAAAAALSLPLLITALLVTAALARLASRTRPVVAALDRDRSAAHFSTPLRGAGWCFCASLLCIGLVIPCAVLAARLGSLNALWVAWSTAGQELATSLLLAAATATVCVLAATVMLLLPRREQHAALVVALLPFLASGPLVGVGMIEVWNRPGVAGIFYDSPAMTVLACATRLAIFAFLAVAVALRQHSTELEEAAALAGANAWYRLWRIRLPLISPALAAAWAMVAVLALNELDTVILVYPPGWTPLSVRMFSLMHYGPSEVVAALCLLNICIVAAALIAARLIITLVKRHSAKTTTPSPPTR